MAKTLLDNNYDLFYIFLENIYLEDNFESILFFEIVDIIVELSLGNQDDLIFIDPLLLTEASSLLFDGLPLFNSFNNSSIPTGPLILG